MNLTFEQPHEVSALKAEIIELKSVLQRTREHCNVLLEEKREIEREAACPCCHGGIVNPGGETCSECKGKGLAIIAYEHGRYQWKNLVARLGGDILALECSHGVSFKEPCEDCGAGAVFGEPIAPLEDRVRTWVKARLGPSHMQSQERSMRLLEEACELAQAESIPLDLVAKLVAHVYDRPAGEPLKEAAGVAVGILGWCAANGVRLSDIALEEVERIEGKDAIAISGSLARKRDAGLVTVER